jgi:hypothetical protein
MMALVIVGLGLVWYEVNRSNRLAEEVSRNSAENNRILKERDFGRLFTEHEASHQEHAEILRKCQ